MDIVSIIVPVYQNELEIDEFVNRMSVLRNKLLTDDYGLDLIFVDDGSSDNSLKILKKNLETFDLKIIKLTRNFGQIPAIQSGLNYASGKYIGIISADLQDPPELFMQMLTYLQAGVKLVVAEREYREDGFFTKIFSNMYWGLVKKYSMKEFPSGGFDFCLFDRQVASELVLIKEKNTNIFPLIYWLGFPPKIIKYKRGKRYGGRSAWTFWKKLKLAVDTIIGFTYLPTRFVSMSAISVSLFAFFYSLYIFSGWLLGYAHAPDGWTTITLLILIIGGVILFSLGIVSEYLLRILDETRKRPNYIIDEIVEKVER